MKASGEASTDIDLVFKALASEPRREILRILGEHTSRPDRECCGTEEVCACELSERLGLAASTISHHTNVLREAGLVGARKKGLWVYYTLRREALDAAAIALRGL